MKKHFEPALLTFEEDNQGRTVRAVIAAKQTTDWTACLCLLHFDLAESIRLHSQDGKFALHLCKDANISRSQRGYCLVEKAQTTLFISSTELDYWTHFFLKIYRDGFLGADHIDLEVETRGIEPQVFTVVLQIGLSSSSLLAEEQENKPKG